MTHWQSPARAGLIDMPGPGGHPGGHPGGGQREPLPLPGTPWSLRTTDGQGARPALEVYAAGVLLDVVVATPLSAGILRGACVAEAGGRPCSLAWGRLPERGQRLAVEFSRLALRPRPQPAQVIEVDWWFWVAMAGGRFATVTAAHPGGQERRRLRALRA